MASSASTPPAVDLRIELIDALQRGEVGLHRVNRSALAPLYGDFCVLAGGTTKPRLTAQPRHSTTPKFCKSDA